MPSIPENGEISIQAPTNHLLNQLSKTTAKPKGKRGPQTTAFSTMSGFSQMSNSSFMNMVNNPFGLSGLFNQNMFA
jgi:hypothetical protein